MKRKLFLLLRLLIGVGILVGLFYFIPYQSIVDLWQKADKKLIGLGFVVFSLLIFLGSYRWHNILKYLGINLPFKKTVFLYVSSLFFNLFFPSVIAGDVFRAAVAAYQNNQKYNLGFLSVIFDRFSGFYGLCLLAFIASLIAIIFDITQKFALIALLFTGLTIMIFYLLRFPYIERLLEYLAKKKIFKLLIHLQKGYKKWQVFFSYKQCFHRAVLQSLIIQIGICLTYYIVGRAFFISISIWNFFIIIPLVTVISSLPITISGIGTRDAVIIYCFAQLGVGKEASLSMSLVVLIFMVLIALLGGIFYVLVSHRWLERNLSPKR